VNLTRTASEVIKNLSHDDLVVCSGIDIDIDLLHPYCYICNTGLVKITYYKIYGTQYKAGILCGNNNNSNLFFLNKIIHT